jgi:hypothetical protein
MINDPLFYACAIPAVLIFGIAKGGFGGGIAVIAVPLMSLAIAPIQAAAIMLPILIVMDAVALWSFKGHWSTENLKIIVPGAIIGVVFGSMTFRYFSDDLLRMLVGFIALAFCLNFWLRPGSNKEHSTKRSAGYFWGAVAGFTSFGIHAGGPPISIYLLPQKMDKILLMGTMAVFFAIVNLVKLVPYSLQGQFATTNLLTSLILMPLAPIGVRLGYYLLHKVSEAFIYRLCYFFLFIVGVKLLFDGATSQLLLP